MIARSSSSARTGPQRCTARLVSGLFTLLVLSGLLWGTGSVQVAHAAATVLPYKNSDGSSENPPLVLYNAVQQYKGQPWVEHHPKVYMIFWGPAWKNDTDNVRQKVLDTFNALPGSQYNNILSEYADSVDYVHNDVSVVSALIDDSSTPPANIDIGFETPLGVWDNAQVRHEVDHIISTKQWSLDADSQVIVFPQKGTTYSHNTGWCGVHSFNWSNGYAFAEIQYGDQVSGCNPVGTVAENITWTAVHEYAEMVTDPGIYASPGIGGHWYTAYGVGWHTQDGTKYLPQEIADLCEGYDAYYGDPAAKDYQDPINGATYSLPLLWSNAFGGCVSADGQDYASPTSSPGRHTVKGAILGQYLSVDSRSQTTVKNLLDVPVSEEVPVTGGRASYFAGGGHGFCPPNTGPYNGCSAIYWSGATGAHFIWAGDYQEYLNTGASDGWAGLPTTNEVSIGGGTVQFFSGGCWTHGPYVDNSCSAIYWSSPTGSHLVHSGDYQEYQTVSGDQIATNIAGFPTTDEITISGGTVQFFNGGCWYHGPYVDNSCSAIYWSGPTGSHMIRQGNYQEYQTVSGNQVGTNIAGFPTTDELTISGGTVQFFSGGCWTHGQYVDKSCSAIYWSGPTGSHLVRQGNYQEYQTVGGNTVETSVAGFPTTDELTISGGTVQYFNGSCYNGGTPQVDNSCSAIYWSGPTGSHLVRSGMYQEYQAVGGNNVGTNVAGYPTTDELGIPGGSVQYFNGSCYNGGTPRMYNSCSAIYFSTATGPHLIRSGDYQLYSSLGDYNGALAYPITDEITIPGGTAQYFTANNACGSPGPYHSDGAIYFSPGTGSHEVHGCIYAEYALYGGGGPGGPLGYPTSDEYTNGQCFRENTFEHGTITWENGQAQVCLGVTC